MVIASCHSVRQLTSFQKYKIHVIVVMLILLPLFLWAKLSYVRVIFWLKLRTNVRRNDVCSLLTLISGAWYKCPLSKALSVRFFFYFLNIRAGCEALSAGRRNGRCETTKLIWCCQLAGKKIMASMSPSERRLQKELMSLMKEPPPGVTVDAEGAGQNLTQWIINMEGAQGTLYEGEQFQLQFKFSSKYPFDSPEVTFIGPNIPVHPHVYSNGHICLSILTEDWSPALSVQSVCLSIVSMLSSCKEKKRPPDNSFYVKTCNKNPKKTKWWYHDDSV